MSDDGRKGLAGRGTARGMIAAPGDRVAAFIRMLLRHRTLAAAGVLVSMGAALYVAKDLQIRFQYRDFYDYPANPNLATFKRDNELFGDPAGYVIAMIEADDVFRGDVLEYVQRLTRALEPLPVFSRVRSLASVNAIRGANDEVVTGRLMEDVPRTEEARLALKQSVLSSPLLVRRLVSADARMTTVLADMRVPAAFATIAEQQEAVAAVEQALARQAAPAGVRVSLTGSPSIEIASTRALLSDQALLLPVVCVVLALMLFLTFRSLQGVVLCLASVGVATLWTVGIFASFQRPVDIIASVIPTTMLVYGVVDPIFVLARFLSKIDAGRPRQEAIVETLSELAMPCFLTSLTTGVGFGAFVTCAAPTIRYYGLAVGIGVLLAFVTTVTVLPLLLSVAPLPKRSPGQGLLARRLDLVLLRLGGFIERHTPVVATAALLILVAGGWAAREQHIDNAYVGSLPSGKTQNDVRLLEQKLAGVGRMNVHLSGPEGSMARPEVLEALQTISRKMEHYPEYTFSASLADLVAEVHHAFEGSTSRERSLPGSKRLITQYVSLLDPRDRAEFVTDNFASAHLAVLLQDRGSERTRKIVGEFERAVEAANFSSMGIEATVTGHGVVAYRALDSVVIDLLYGFVTAFSIVIFFEWLTFRSLRLALLTIVPNLIPVVICFLTTRLLHIPLRIDSILVLCISIGGLFNTTIHIVARVLQQLNAGQRDPAEIVVAAMRAIGPPSLFTSVVLSTGFAVFVLSSFPGLRVLGLLTMVTLLTGFVSDMIFTPALVRAGLDWKKAMSEQDEKLPGASEPLPTT
jgi:predicted RND superfamily exporter protein